MATTDLKRAQTRISTTAPVPESADESQARIARVEQRMLDAEAMRTAADTPARETKSVSYTSYEAALAAGREIGASRADDAALMALFCEGPLQTLVGAVSPELVWDGAQRRGLTTRELGGLANSDVMAVSDLQWVDDTPTAPLSPAASVALARLELAFAPVFAEQLRVERLASGLRAGESMVINGSRVTAVSLAVAEAVATYRKAALRVAALGELADLAEAGIELSDMHADDLDHAEALMAGARATLADAGMLHLIGGA